MLTYKLETYGDIPEEYYKESLERLGFVESTDSVVDYHIYLQWKTKDYNTKCTLKNKIDNISPIIDKSRIYTTMKWVCKENLAREYTSRQVLDKGKITVEGPLIVKPSGGLFYSGKGIEIVTKGDEIKRGKSTICEYVTDVATFMGKKFHLRVLLFLSTWGKWRIVPMYKIVTAKLPYERRDWKNKDIHDTHWESTDSDYFFYPDGDMYDERIDMEIIKICNELVRSVKPLPFSESKKAYEMLGLDFLIKKDGTPIILEVNNWAGTCSKPGAPTEKIAKYKRKIVKVEMKFVRECFNL